jgi:Phosphoserine aminotransferase
MEISHRAKDFKPVVDEAVALFKELLNIPEGYSVLFLGGGASMEFCMVPYNFLEKKAAYLNTGVWAKKAMKEAKAFGEVVEVCIFCGIHIYIYTKRLHNTYRCRLFPCNNK